MLFSHTTQQVCFHSGVNQCLGNMHPCISRQFPQKFGSAMQYQVSPCHFFAFYLHHDMTVCIILCQCPSYLKVIPLIIFLAWYIWTGDLYPVSLKLYLLSVPSFRYINTIGDLCYWTIFADHWSHKITEKLYIYIYSLYI